MATGISVVHKPAKVVAEMGPHKVTRRKHKLF